MIEISLAKSTEHYKTIEVLAYTIWNDHYIPIIGKAQVDYMLEKFQSAAAIENQIADGFEYYLLIYKSETVGYLAIKPEESALFLSKIYVLPHYRGQKIGKKAMDFVEKHAKDSGKTHIRLTVNKNNVQSVEVYKKLGFKLVGPIVIDIGHGFVMDDFEMVKML
ncbi:GNAT family N-acetyltransferase [Tamlana crocina]|uniref:GNAT family N-acetyltransferase n=1 Tax=Tamlana crocina TaxID=393006 RepID=A0ABX1DE74_9FLAO|nr:GNAT family N-acetyltransferase [Tamlana crocina]NJX16645.1 GNAT family N-acetyltransferase [Tamlana crocina]